MNFPLGLCSRRTLVRLRSRGVKTELAPRSIAPQFHVPNRAFAAAILARYNHFFGMLMVLVLQRPGFFPLTFFTLAMLSGLILPLSALAWKALWIALCFSGLSAARRMGPMRSPGELCLRGDIAQGCLIGLLAPRPIFAVAAAIVINLQETAKV